MGSASLAAVERSFQRLRGWSYFSDASPERSTPPVLGVEPGNQPESPAGGGGGGGGGSFLPLHYSKVSSVLFVHKNNLGPVGTVVMATEGNTSHQLRSAPPRSPGIPFIPVHTVPARSLHPPSYSLHPTPHFLHHKPSASHTTSSTLHPAPRTPHPAPSIQHPIPSTTPLSDL